MKITKAVIPAAGLGTRVLPATKAMPKEMLPIIDKPAIQYIVEEAAKSGITDILIIISRGKSIVEDHFDRAPELEKNLLAHDKIELYNSITELSDLANITYVRQQEPKGLGHAVMLAKTFVGDDPFAVMYGDDVVIGENPAIGQLCEAYDEFGKGVIGIKEVSFEFVQKYSSMKIKPIRDRLFEVSDMIEKPKPEQIFSNYAILGRCVLPSKIFDILENTPVGAGGELQLTDAMKMLALNEGMIGVDFVGSRYDMGNKLGILKAWVEQGLLRNDFGDEFKDFLIETVKKFN
ncbi:MAG TPA: UTP--glucose-1-phosphate uridylyltransferase GalU [Oscillospiraceae bacterium]|nr:UTP--glucose-1-phosphate uridylyltransferase GalU [Oscillospiraceae bacterium]